MFFYGECLVNCCAENLNQIDSQRLNCFCLHINLYLNGISKINQKMFSKNLDKSKLSTNENEKWKHCSSIKFEGGRQQENYASKNQ